MCTSSGSVLLWLYACSFSVDANGSHIAQGRLAGAGGRCWFSIARATLEICSPVPTPEPTTTHSFDSAGVLLVESDVNRLALASPDGSRRDPLRVGGVCGYVPWEVSRASFLPAGSWA